MAEERERRPKKSLVDKLRWPIVVSVVVALLLVSYVQIRTSGQVQRRQIFRVQQGTAEDIALSVTAYLQRAGDGLHLLAQTRDLMSMERAEQRLTIERLLTQWEDIYEEITLLNQDGVEVAKVSRFHTYLPEELGNRAHTTAFQQALAGETYSADEVVISPYSSLPTVEIAVPVSDLDSGDVVGVLMAEASVKRMWDVVAGAKVGETGYAYVVNDAGRLQAHSDLAQYLRLQDEDLSETPAMGRIKASQEELDAWGFTGMEKGAQLSSLWWILFPPRFWEYTGLGGQEVVGAWASIEETPWTVVVDLPTAEAYRGLRQMTLTLLGVLGVVAVAIGGVTSALPQLVVRPLARLERGARLLSSGQLDHRIVLHTEDELEALADAFNEMASRLQELYAGLEQQVAERTRDLERRAVQLEAAAEVARDAAAIHDVNQLLDETVHLISEQFGFYHAGIFLIDDAGKYAVLQAASSEGGQRMLARQHKLKVGEVGIVGYAAGTGTPRVALDVGEDAVFFDNPDLPRTRSEMALPLTVRGQVIGVLDVQSREEAAFSDEDVAVLGTMADQVAVAIESARLLEESQRALREIEIAQRERIRAAWGELGQVPAFEYDRVGVRPADADSIPFVDQALHAGEIVVATEPGDGHSALAAPLRLRDEVIGALTLEEADGARSWTEDEIELVEAVSEQVALALENARLYTDAQRRAREQEGLARVAALAASTLDLEELLHQLVEEARQLLGAEDAVLLLLDEERQVLTGRSLSAGGRLTSVPEEWEVPLDAPGFEQSIFARSGAYYSNTGMDDPNLIPAYRPYVDELQARNFCGVPLLVRERSIGELYVVNRPGGFGQDEVRLLRAVAGYVANAIQNARLFEEAQVRAEELAVLNELGQALTARLNVDDVLEETYRGASQLLDTANFYVALYHAEKDEVIFVFDVTEGDVRKPYTKRTAGQGLTEYVIHNRQSLFIPENVGERMEELGIEMIGQEALSWLGVPLMVGDQVLGVMAVQSYSVSRAYDSHDKDLLTAIASQTAIALESARLFESAQRRARRERLIREVTAKIVGSTDLDTVLKTTAQELGKVLGTSRTLVRLGKPPGPDRVDRAEESEDTT